MVHWGLTCHLSAAGYLGQLQLTLCTAAGHFQPAQSGYRAQPQARPWFTTPLAISSLCLTGSVNSLSLQTLQPACTESVMHAHVRSSSSAWQRHPTSYRYPAQPQARPCSKEPLATRSLCLTGSASRFLQPAMLLHECVLDAAHLEEQQCRAKALQFVTCTQQTYTVRKGVVSVAL